jgi:hypothetical protein
VNAKHGKMVVGYFCSQLGVDESCSRKGRLLFISILIRQFGVIAILLRTVF